MSASRRIFWLVMLALLAIGTPAAGLLFSWSATGSIDLWANKSAHQPEASAREVSPRLVCFGRVDLEHGVTSLAPLSPGRVKSVTVREGDSVAAGAVLIQLEDDQARSRVAEAKAAVESAELQLTQASKAPEQHKGRIAQQQDAVDAAKARLQSARLHLDRQKHQSKSITNDDDIAVSEQQVRELDALKRVEEQRLADLRKQDPLDEARRAEKQVAVMKAKLHQAQLALGDCALKAPRAGTVLRILVGPGDVFGPQSKQAAVLFAAAGPQVVRAEVEQEFIGRVAVGQAVTIEDEANAEGSWRGKVARIANWFTQRRTIMQNPNEFNDVPTVECLVTLDDGQPVLRIGQRVRVILGAATARER